LITIYSYDIAAGTLSNPTVEELPEVYESGNVDLWIDLEAPTPEEADILRTVFNFHELAIEDCIAIDIEEAKLDDYEDYLFFGFHSVFFDSSNLSFDIIELDMFFGKKFVVTHHKKPTVGISQLKKRLEQGNDFMAEGTDGILHAVIDSLVDNYTVTVKQIERSIFSLEEELLSAPTNKTFNNLFKLKSILIHLHRLIAPESQVIESLANSEHGLIQEETTVYFDDIHDHISTIEGLLDSYMDMVKGTMDTYVSIANVRLQKIMQILTIISTIMLPPTLIASFYGMNFKHLPLEDLPYGFEIISVLCLMFAGSMLWYFRKQGWF